MPATSKKKSHKRSAKQPNPKKLARITRKVDAYMHDVYTRAEKLGAKFDLENPVRKRNRERIREQLIQCALE